MSIGGWSDQTTPTEEVTDKFLPVTLAQRGLALPFTTRPVAYARVIMGKNGLEVILPGFSDKLIAHVIPFETLPSITSLSVFDRTLHEAVGNLSQLSPTSIREAASTIGETGLGGITLMRKARAKKVIFTNLEPAILNHLVDEMIKKHGSKDAPQNINMSTDEGMIVATKELDAFGKSHQSTGSEIVERLVALSKLMAHYRGVQEGLNGPIKDTLARLQNLSNDLRQWLLPEPVEEAEMAQRASIAALGFIQLAEPYVKELDSVYGNLEDTIVKWDLVSLNLRSKIDDLDLLLDGWERILDAWDNVLTARRFIQRETLASFAPFIPIPSKDIIKENSKTWLELRTAQLRWMGRVKYMKDMTEDAEQALRNTRMEVL